ncbi:hypothetical protein PG990_013394 [Apiospora arundinis]
MHLKDLRNNSLTKRLRGGSRASTDDDVKDPPSKATASAPTEQASVKQPPTQKDTEDRCRRNLNRRQYYTRVFDDRNTKILEDFNDRLIVSAGYRSNPQYITNVIRQCCNTVSSCLLDEWLLRQSCSSSTSSSSSIRSDAYEHIEVSRQRLCIFLADIDYTADQDMESASMAQLVSGELIGITISAITVVALDAGKALGSERATMTLSHSLLASAHIAAHEGEQASGESRQHSNRADVQIQWQRGSLFDRLFGRPDRNSDYEEVNPIMIVDLVELLSY